MYLPAGVVAIAVAMVIPRAPLETGLWDGVYVKAVAVGG